jgi:hypothetical protein
MRFFSSLEHSYHLIAPPSLDVHWVSGTPSLGVKRPGHEAGQSSVFNAKVKNVWRYNSVPLGAFMAFTAITARALFIWIGLAVHRFITSALDGQINSVPLL